MCHGMALRNRYTPLSQNVSIGDMMPHTRNPLPRLICKSHKLVVYFRNSLLVHYQKYIPTRCTYHIIRFGFVYMAKVMLPFNIYISIMYRYMFVMPAYCRGANSLGTKLVTLYPDNDKKGLSTHLGIVLLFEASTGMLQAVSV